MESYDPSARRTSDNFLRGRELARTFDKIERISRRRAIIALKRAYPRLGLSRTARTILEELFACTKEHDWSDPDSRPIVWPSNEDLMERTDLSLSSVKRGLRELTDKRIITHTDSPNYKRSGTRDPETDRIVKAYGIDLSPIAVRYAEFSALGEDLQKEKRRRKELRDERTILRRLGRQMISDAMDRHLAGLWSRFSARLDRLIETRPPRDIDALEEHVSAFRELVEEIELARLEALNKETFHENKDPKGAKSGPHIRTTTELPIVECSDERHRAKARSIHSPDAGFAGDMAFEEKPVQRQSSRQDRSPIAGLRNVSPHVLKAAMPFLMAEHPDIFDDPRMFTLIVQHQLAAIGVSADAWREAVEELGDMAAGLCGAVIIERHAKGQIARPGGCLRAMVRKNRTGDLHIDRSIYGLASRRVFDDAYPHGHAGTA